MGLWQRIFGPRPPAASAIPDMIHPILGPINMDLGPSWFSDEVETIGHRGRPSLFIAGDESGPTTECIATYLRLREDWATISVAVADAILSLNSEYPDKKPNQILASRDDALKAAELVTICIDRDGDFELSYELDWRHKRDDHLTTVVFENWKFIGCSVDG